MNTGLDCITIVHVDNSYIADVSGILTFEMYIIVYILLITFKTKTKFFTEFCVDLNLLTMYVYSFYTYIYYLSVYLLFKSEFIQFNLNLDIIVYTLHFLIDIFIKVHMNPFIISQSTLCIKMSLHQYMCIYI